MRLCRHHGGSTPRPPIGMEPSSLVMSGSLPTRKLDCRRDNFPFASDSPAMSAEPDVHGDAYRVGIANFVRDLSCRPGVPTLSDSQPK
jgi:hypothetical protein